MFITLKCYHENSITKLHEYDSGNTSDTCDIYDTNDTCTCKSCGAFYTCV